MGGKQMAALLIILAALVLLFIAYIFYGSWLAKEWGIDPKRKTPAEEMADDIDYVTARPAVLLGHHFSSIAGAGPINGPIQAAVFGWVPVFLWCLIGGIFFGGLQDFGSLFASIRNEGKSVGEIIKASVSPRAKKLFLIFALLVLLLLIASFINVVAGTFLSTDGRFGIVPNPTGHQTTAMISALFIVLAVIYGILTNRFGMKTLPATIIGLVGIVFAVIIGLYYGLAMSRTAWIVFIGAYIAIASLVPVWILLQPRDYLSSYLLYGMMGMALVGIVVSAVTGNAEFHLPAFTSWKTSIGPIFPALFITVACGACSGFHALVATGTTSKQLDNEKHAKAIGYGSMLIESALAIISLIAVGMVSKNFIVDGSFKGAPPIAFASGVAAMFGFHDNTNAIYALLTLAISVFALTSLDSATRLSRFMFTELFLEDGEKTFMNAKGARKILAHPLFGTLVMVFAGCTLGGLSLNQIWGLFGAANQLLASIALMAIAAWLSDIGKNNNMFSIPSTFMLYATLTHLVIIIIKKVFAMVTGVEGAFHWGNWFQMLFSIGMIVLVVFLIVEGTTLKSRHKERRATAAKTE